MTDIAKLLMFVQIFGGGQRLMKFRGSRPICHLSENDKNSCLWANSSWGEGIEDLKVHTKHSERIFYIKLVSKNIATGETSPVISSLTIMTFITR